MWWKVRSKKEFFGERGKKKLMFNHIWWSRVDHISLSAPIIYTHFLMKFHSAILFVIISCTTAKILWQGKARSSIHEKFQVKKKDSCSTSNLFIKALNFQYKHNLHTPIWLYIYLTLPHPKLLSLVVGVRKCMLS